MIDRDWVAVSHRFSNFVSLINTKAFNGTSRVLLPGNGGKMAYSTSTGKLYVADHSAGQVYEIDMDTQEVVRTIAGMKNMSDILVDDRNIEKPMLWFTSRTKNKLVQVDLTSGEALKAFDAGEKPVSIRQAGDLLFVVSASSDELQLIDMQAGQKLLPIAMEPGAFPTDITISPADQKGYVAAAGTDHVYVVDFGTRNVEKTLPIEARGLDVLLISDTPTSSDVLKAFSSALIDSATPEPTLAPLQESPQGPLEPESASAKVSILD